MGLDFLCGCRTSMGAWYPCDKHEAEIMRSVIEYEATQFKGD